MNNGQKSLGGEVETAGCPLFDYAVKLGKAAKLSPARVLAAEALRRTLTPEEAEARLTPEDRDELCETLRRMDGAAIAMQVQSPDKASERARLEATHGTGNVWTTEELRERFEILGFGSPLVVVRERETGKRGTVYFQHDPRLYFGWEPED